MAEEESLTIEETNKLRISLGLKPLNVRPSDASSKSTGAAMTSEDQERLAADNLRAKREKDEQTRKSKETSDRLRKARERAERDRKLKGKTLADEEEEDEGTLAWIKRTKNSVPKSSLTLNASEEAVKKTEGYTAEHMKGLRVGHDMDELEDGDPIVLTLKDNEVLDDEAADELVNVDLHEKQALKTKLANKKRKSVYTTYEDDEIDETTGQRKILARYDEDVDAKPKSSAGFVIDTAAAGERASSISAAEPSVRPRKIISLEDSDFSRPIVSDYAEPIKLRKSKNKKTFRRPRQETGNVERDNPRSAALSELQNHTLDAGNLVDDDDLQASLARQRRMALQRRALLKPEQIVAAARDSPEPEVPSQTDGLVLDETTEFTRGLQDIKVVAPRVKTERSSHEHEEMRQQHDPAGDQVMTDSEVATIKIEPVLPEISTTGIDEELTLDGGIGAAMAVLRQKGVLACQDDEESARKQAQEAWLAKHQKIRLEIEAERRRVREALRNSPQYRNMSARDREALAASENRRLDALEAKAAQERFREYRPNVQINYVDDFGRNMTQKEAFKHMSHQFHGKNSGSGKTAKKLAQIQKEKANEQKSLFK